VIATKVGFRTGTPITQAGLSRRQILASCDASLVRLGTDYIDLYIVHKEDPFTPLEETLTVLDDLVRAGKVRYLGYSNWSAWKAATALQMQKTNGLAPFISGQMYYSIIGRDVEHEVIPFMRFAGLGMTVWSPLTGGFLSGKYTRDNFSDPANRLSGLDVIPFDKDVGFRVVDRLRQIARLHGASVSQVALTWLLAKPVVSSVIIGASKIQQLQDNLGAANLRLREAEIEEVDAITAPRPMYPTWFNNHYLDAQLKAALGEDSRQDQSEFGRVSTVSSRSIKAARRGIK
jgi:aryl-alcohol dehydrogenase-like predicted oxidoreductase